MSRTSASNKSNGRKNPVKYRISFKGDKGVFSFNKKMDDGSWSEVTLDNLSFVLVDTRCSIVGWDDSSESNIYSNLVSKTSEEQFLVRSKKGVIVEGLYADVKEKISAAGGKFCTNLFVLAKVEDQFVPCMLQLTGSSLAAWSEFTKEKRIKELYNFVLSASRGEEQKKGKVKFFRPKFDQSPLPQEVAEAADKFDHEELQPFLVGEEPEKESQDDGLYQ